VNINSVDYLNYIP